MFVFSLFIKKMQTDRYIRLIQTFFDGKSILKKSILNHINYESVLYTSTSVDGSKRYWEIVHFRVVKWVQQALWWLHRELTKQFSTAQHFWGLTVRTIGICVIQILKQNRNISALFWWRKTHFQAKGALRKVLVSPMASQVQLCIQLWISEGAILHHRVGESAKQPPSNLSKVVMLRRSGHSFQGISSLQTLITVGSRWVYWGTNSILD